MPAPLLLPVLLAAGLGYVVMRRRKDSPDTPTSELLEALSEVAGKPIDCQIVTGTDGQQIIRVQSSDPMAAADLAMLADLPAILIAANLDLGTVDFVPHPDRCRGEAMLLVSSEGEVLAVDN